MNVLDSDFEQSYPDLTVLPTRTYPANEKFLLMDYSPWLGFNNMRYMLERGIYLASLLNRTFVIPTHLRIRQCSDETVCSQTATPLDLASIGHNPQGSTLALDLGYFIDLDHLSQQTNGRIIDFRTFMEQVVKVHPGTALVDSQFGEQVAFWKRVMNEDPLKSGVPSSDVLRFRAVDDDVDEEDENKPTHWDNLERDYHHNLDSWTEVSMTRVNRAKWSLDMDSSKSFIDNLIRNGLVDDLETPDPALYAHAPNGSFNAKKIFYAFGDVRGGGLNRIMSWSVDFHYRPQDASRTIFKATPQLDSHSCTPPTDDPAVDQIPWEARFPSFATCRIENYVGVKQELDALDAKIVSVEGQFHTAGWIPLIYSDLESALRYRSMAVSHLRYTPAVEEATEHLLQQLRHRLGPSLPALQQGSFLDNHGAEPWFPLSMHIRRGDFITDQYGWQEFDEAWMKTLVDNAISTVFSPLSNDLPAIFYLATDESSPAILDYFHSVGAILFEDLIDDAFEARFGHLIVYDDWIGLVEQLICARAKKFYGTMTSSFTSGIVNLRVVQYGLDREEDFEYLIKAGGPVLPQQNMT
ncbi:hypothetical protein BG000_011837 [Podila horticola]|nr:hypothetical protein BG000_011837 [Podila horticola]